MQGCVRELIAAGLVAGAADLAEGGLAVTLAELAITSSCGVDCQSVEPGGQRADTAFFGEGPSRIIIASGPRHRSEIEAAAARWEVPLTRIGAAGGDAIRIGQVIHISLQEAAEQWAPGLDRWMRV